MRIAAQVLLAYVLLIVLGAAWRFVPLGRAAPDVVALSAVYLGLTARGRLAPAIFGATVLGYLADLLIGTPRGMLALGAGIMCILGRVTHRRLIVRGWGATLAVSFFTGLVSGVVAMCLRAYAGIPGAGLGVDLVVSLYAGLLTAAVGPVMLRLCRIIDARFARTLRERDAAMEGLVP